MTCLAHTHGKSQKLGISTPMLERLRAVFGPCMDRFWWETIGFRLEELTELEAGFLIGRREVHPLWRDLPDGPAILEQFADELRSLSG